MVIYHRIDDLEDISSSVLTIGTFDGIHRGHQEIISRTVRSAKQCKCPSVLITFDPHPQHILRKANHPVKLIITPLDYKIRLIRKLGIDFVLILPFDRQLAGISAEDFFNEVILRKFNPAKIIIGYDHHFGHKREGDKKFLFAKSQQHHFELEVIPPVCDGTTTISSSAIRRAVELRDFDTANRFLGYNFELSGIVVPGKGRGKKLNFPTANIQIIDKTILKPAVGVYCVRVELDDMKLNGACNIGYRPTFNEHLSHPLIEINIFESTINDLYGRILTVQFIKFVRDELKFESPDQLVKQLIFDREFCLNLHEK